MEKKNNNQNITDPITRRDALKGAAYAGIAMSVMPFANSVLAQQAMNEWRESLRDHRITRIEQRATQNRWPRLVGKNARLDVHGWGRDSSVLIVHCDSGASGFGYAPGTDPEAAAELSERYQGASLTDLFEPALGRTQGVPKQLDFALHDLAGKILGIPVYEMIGNAAPEPVPVYSGMIYFDDLEPYDQQPGIDQVLFNAGADHAFGYRQMKIKVGRGGKWMEHDAGLQRDIDVTRALANAYPDVQFLADANDGFSIQDTTDYLNGIGEVELYFMEEPFRENIEGFTQLRRYLDATGSATLIADGEARPDQEQIEDLINRGLLDLHLTDIYGLGFTEWRALMPSLIQRGVVTSPHTWGARLKTVYTAHLAWGMGNVPTVEGVSAFSRDIDFSDYDPDGNGMLVPVAKPGFGLELI